MKVAIIGAGVSGLAAARRALQYDLEIVVFEESDRIGGIWNYSEDPNDGSSPIYANLRTNLPVQLMEFTGYKFEAESGLCYPPHQDVLKYINDFADHYKLHEWIKFHTRVTKVVRTKNSWRVNVQDLLENPSCEEQYIFDAVMVCNGHYVKPFVPFIPGQDTFTGRIIHSHVYRRNSPFANLRVLVVGNGPSGRDIANECSKVAAEVIVSCRDQADQGVILEENITTKPQIKFIQESQVFFEDNTSNDVDVILLCTGYLYDLPFLSDESCGVKIRNGRVIEPLYKGFINITQPSMCFLGLLQRTFIFAFVDLQAEVFIKHLLGLIQLPDRRTLLASFNEEDEFKKSAGIPEEHYFYMGGKNAEDHCISLFHLGDIKPFPPVLFKMYYENMKRMKQRKIIFLRFEVIDDENYVCYPEN